MHPIDTRGPRLRLCRTGLALLAAGLLALGAALPAAAQQAPEAGQEEREGFYRIEELERLFRMARESGFTEEQIREITIGDDGREINAWDYLQRLKRRRAQAREEEREKREAKYLTVQDIFAELDEDREEELTRIREESVFTD